MAKVLVARGQHLTGVEIGDQPGLCRAIGDGHRADRLDAGVSPRGRAGADKGEGSRDCGEKHPHGTAHYRAARSAVRRGREVFNRPMLSHAEISDRLEIQQLTR